VKRSRKNEEGSEVGKQEEGKDLRRIKEDKEQ
jgi:hypothetical protein